MSFLSNIRQQRGLSAVLILFTLVIGILIGTLMHTGVRADRAQEAPDAEPLTIPDPVKMQNEFTRLAQRLEPAVVNITTEYNPDPQEMSSQGGEPSDEELDLFRRFFGERGTPQSPRAFRRQATGSGFIVDPKGYIITNYHVVEGADTIKVRLMEDITEHKADLVGFDVETDLAVIKINTGSAVPAVEIGNSDATSVGDWAIAIGSPFGLESTVTVGIVSAKERDIGTQQFQRFIQTDAAINRGNSGGPLVNIRGEVIGVNTMIATNNGGYQGVGFALPINTAVKVYNQLIQSGRVTRGSIGVSFARDEDPHLLPALGVDHGVVINDVQPNGPADRAGLRPDDILLEMNGEPIRDGDDLVARVADTPVGETATLTVDRGGERKSFDVTIGDRAEVWADDPRFSFYREQQQEDTEEGTEARFGIYVKNLTPRELEEMKLEDGAGIKVSRVEAGSFADELGLREDDVILSINRQSISSVDDIKRIQATLKSGDPVAIRVARPIPLTTGGNVEWRPFYVAGQLP
jgi:serine protease Do